MLQKTAIVFDQIYVLVLRDFKLKYNSTALGFLWSFLVPVLQSLVYYAVFNSVARFGIRNYLLYMLSGMFLWYFFSGAVTMSLHCFPGNATLLKKTAFDRSLLVFSRLLTELIHFLLIIPVMFLLMLVYKIVPGWSVLTMPIILLEFFFFTAGICYALATLNVFFRDLERIIGVLLQAWFFMSPIFYHLDNLHGKLRVLVMWCNPISCYMEGWRNIFYDPVWNWKLLAIGVVPALLSWLIGYGIFRHKCDKIAEQM